MSRPNTARIAGEPFRGQRPRKDAAFGEALRAISLYAVHGPDLSYDDQATALLERAYRVLVARGRSFSAEDFSLYVLSRQLDRVPPVDHAAFRRGAARYLREHLGRVSAEFRALAKEASCLVAEPAPRPVLPDPSMDHFLDEGALLLDEFVFSSDATSASDVYLLTQPIFVPRTPHGKPNA